MVRENGIGLADVVELLSDGVSLRLARTWRDLVRVTLINRVIRGISDHSGVYASLEVTNGSLLKLG